MCTWVIENLVRLTHFHYVCETRVWKVHFFLWLFFGILKRSCAKKTYPCMYTMIQSSTFSCLKVNNSNEITLNIVKMDLQ